MLQIRTYCSSGGCNKSLTTMSSTALLLSSWWQTDSITFLFILPESALCHQEPSVVIRHPCLSFWWLPPQITWGMCCVSVCWGKGQRVRVGETCEGDFLSPRSRLNTHHWLWLQHSLLFNKCCGAKEDGWGSWGVTGAGVVGVEKEAEEERGQAI